MEFDSLHVDCGKLSFLDPAGLCLLHHWFEQLSEADVKIQLHTLNLEVESFLRRMDVFTGIPNLAFEDHTSTNARSDLTNSLVELCTVSEENEVDEVAQRIANAVVHNMLRLSNAPDPDGMRPSPEERATDTLAYVFAEVINNAVDHGKKRGWRNARAKVAAVFYGRLQRLKIAIVDNGCGLLQTLQGHAKMDGDDSHAKAVEIALLPKVSCNRDQEYGWDSKNQGIGLTVSTSLAVDGGGEFAVFSGDALLRRSTHGVAFSSAIPNWQGTGVCLEFECSRLAEIDKVKVIQNLPGFREVPELRFN